MDKYRIYLAGGMTGLSHDEQWGWRKDFRDKVMDNIDLYGYDLEPVFFNPLMHYDLEMPEAHKSEREVFDLDTYYLRKSDLVVVNFNSPNSIGSAMELAIANDNRIPIIGLNEDGAELHPWLVECCTRICDTMEELVDHVGLQYLII